MHFISHRGNLKGPNIDEENSIPYIEDAFNQDFEVEIDVWFKDKLFYLGHDNPQYEVSLDFLKNDRLWIHAKNLECIYELSKFNLNYFWHQNDKVAITSNGYFWNYPGTELSKKSIAVLPERNNFNDIDKNCSGFCSDYIFNLKNEFIKTK